MRDGQIESVEKIRTKRAALARVLELTLERIGSQIPVRLATSHANAELDASMLLAAARAQLNPVETFCRPLSPVIGAHVGPGTVALAYMTGFA
jgi:fatty acid-binding protein DegV